MSKKFNYEPQEDSFRQMDHTPSNRNGKRYRLGHTPNMTSADQDSAFNSHNSMHRLIGGGG